MLESLLRDVETRLGLALREDARRAGTREATARVLLALGPEESVPMGEVARRVGRDATTATRFVDRAVTDGLLARHRGADDRRRRVVELTARGRAAREGLLAARTARSDRLAASMLAETGLDRSQVEWFLAALGRTL